MQNKCTFYFGENFFLKPENWDLNNIVDFISAHF